MSHSHSLPALTLTPQVVLVVKILPANAGDVRHEGLILGQGTKISACHTDQKKKANAPGSAHSLGCCSVVQSCLTLCKPMDCSTPEFPVLHHLLELARTHVH